MSLALSGPTNANRSISETYAHLPSDFTSSEKAVNARLVLEQAQHGPVLVKVYLARARPLLAEDGNDYLFPGWGLHYKGPGVLSKQIAETAKKVLGARVTGHQFRHLIGYVYLKDNPNGHEVVRRFLGHKRIETTIAFYAGMEQAAAIAHLDRFIEARRQRIVRPQANRTRKAPLGCAPQQEGPSGPDNSTGS